MNHRNWLKLTILFFALAVRSHAQPVLQSFVFSNDVARFPTVSLNAVAFGGTNFVAVGTNATIWTTHLINTNGTAGWLNLATNWSKKVPGSASVGFEAAAYGNGIFITGGSGNQVFKSTDDGLNWSGLGNAFPDALDIKGLTHAGGNYVAASQGLDITYSSSLSTWTESTINSQVIFEGYRGLSAYGANSAIVCGVGGVVRVSTDSGVTWNISDGNSYDGSQATLFGAAGDGNNHLVCVGASGTIKASANNGSSWSTFAVGGNDLNAVAWTGIGFIAVGNGGAILVSSNGSTSSSWKSLHSPTSVNFTGVTFGTNGAFQNIAMLVGAGGQVVIGGVPPTGSVVSNTNGSICNGSSVDVTVNLGGSQGPWNVTLTDGTNDYVTSTSSSNVTFKVFPANTNQNASAAYDYVLKSVIDEVTGFSAPAGNLTGNFAVTNNPRPTALASGTTAICNGGSTPVQVALTGVGPWTVTLSSNGVTLPPVVVGSSGPGPYTNIFTVSPTNTSLNAASISTYAVTNLTDANCTAEAVDLSGNAAITVNPRPTAQVTGTTAICNGGSTFVPVTFTGIGPWTVNLSSNGVTLAAMVVGPSAPGPYTTNFTVSPTNTSLNAASISTYAVTNLADENCTAEKIDLTGNAAITVNPRPTAQVSGTTAICNGGSTLVPVIFTGIGPWTVTLSSNGVALPPVVVGVSGPGPYTTNFTVSPTNTSLNAASISTYSVTALTDATACSANSGDLSGSAVITVNPRPTAAVSGTTAICNGGSTPVQVSFTGIGPWTVALSSNGVTLPPVVVGPAGPGPYVTNFTVSPTNTSLNAASSSTYSVTNLTDTHCTAEAIDLTGTAAITVNPRPTAAVSGTTAICNGGSTFVTVNLTGIGPWLLTLSSNGVAMPPVVVGPSAPGPYTTNFTVGPTNTSLNAASTSTYVVSVLADAHCTAEGIDLTGSAAITVNPRPTAHVTGTTAICNGGSTVVPVTLTGIGPWTVTLSSNGVALLPVVVGPNGPGPFTTNFTVSPTNANPDLPSTSAYLAANLSDTNCTAENIDLTGNAVITVNPRPTAALSGPPLTICNGGTAMLPLTLHGLGPWTIAFASNGVILPPVTIGPPGPGPFLTNYPVSPTNTNPDTSSTSIYAVSSVSNNDTCIGNQPGDITGTIPVTVDPRPTAALSGPTLTICNGGTAALPLTLHGFGPWTVAFSSNGVVLPPVTLGPAGAGPFFINYPVTPTNTNPDAQFTSTYALSSVSNNDTCVGNQPGDLAGTIPVVVNPRPMASLSGTTEAICSGAAAVLPLTLHGLGPWTVTFSSNGVVLPPVTLGPAAPGPFLTNYSVGLINTNALVASTNAYYVTSVLNTDTCAGNQPGDITGTNTVVVNPLPVPTSLGNQTNCAGVTNPPLVVSVVTNATFPAGSITVDWFDSGTNGALLVSGTNAFTPTNTAPNTYIFWAQASATNTNCGCVCVNSNRTPVTLVLQDCTSTNSGWPQIQTIGTNVVVTWLGNVDLQYTNALTSVTNGWTNVATGAAGITNSFTNSSGDSNGFFRLFTP